MLYVYLLTMLLPVYLLAMLLHVYLLAMLLPVYLLNMLLAQLLSRSKRKVRKFTTMPVLSHHGCSVMQCL